LKRSSHTSRRISKNGFLLVSPIYLIEYHWKDKLPVISRFKEIQPELAKTNNKNHSTIQLLFMKALIPLYQRGIGALKGTRFVDLIKSLTTPNWVGKVTSVTVDTPTRIEAANKRKQSKKQWSNSRRTPRIFTTPLLVPLAYYE